ncbi:c-type cytochrome [Salipaludibacillus aurantiacus]|uniref:Cytochrome c551/cytochrome c550 n=1 Tax=Salipaludibacillus aurantiacus TaxID=1601833 RepID=A0A1H9VKP5_9BACI|nr:cytochrome c [Salipaludibacillus aurantiacus]SES22346.1 cytochrome c551/cytochrome c550 [Salipaludibacillus aurantiacus]
MKKLITVLLGTSLLIAACGDGNNDTNEALASETASNGSYDLMNGEEVYVKACASCHGGDLRGAGAGGVTNLTYEEVLDAVVNGSGIMPAGLVTGSDAEDVSAWVHEAGKE